MPRGTLFHVGYHAAWHTGLHVAGVGASTIGVSWDMHGASPVLADRWVRPGFQHVGLPRDCRSTPPTADAAL